MQLEVEQRLKSLGLELPRVTKPRGNFRPYMIAASTLYISGKGSPLRSGIGPVQYTAALMARDIDQVLACYTEDIAMTKVR